MCTKLSLRERKIYAIEEKLQNSMPAVVWASGLFHYGIFIPAMATGTYHSPAPATWPPPHFGRDLVPTSCKALPIPADAAAADGDLVVSLRTNISWLDVLNSINCHRQTAVYKETTTRIRLSSYRPPSRCNFNQNSHVCAPTDVWRIGWLQLSQVTGHRMSKDIGDLRAAQAFVSPLDIRQRGELKLFLTRRNQLTISTKHSHLINIFTCIYIYWFLIFGIA